MNVSSVVLLNAWSSAISDLPPRVTVILAEKKQPLGRLMLSNARE
jgi:hypothetical protein